MNNEPLKVFLDSNVFIGSQYNLQTGSLVSFGKYCDNGNVILCSNDIVIREVIRNIRQEVDELARIAKNAIKQKAPLFNSIPYPVYKNIENTLLSTAKNAEKAFIEYTKML